MTAPNTNLHADSLMTLAAANAAAGAIAPAWPLASSVAVNPFLGQTAEDLGMVAARLRRVTETVRRAAAGLKPGVKG